MACAQLGEACVLADDEIEVKLDAALGQERVPPGDHVLLQLEVGDAIDEEAAGAIVAVVDMNGISLAAKLLGGGEPGGTGANDADRQAELATRLPAA